MSNSLITFLFLVPSVNALAAVYLSRDTCGGALTVTDSVQVESSTGLTYRQNMDCTYTISVSAPYRVLANIKRLELEPKISGTCHDYVNLHDSNTTSSSTLNSEPLCGAATTNIVYVSSGQHMSIHFVTDSTAVYLGFNIIFTKASIGACDATQFSCNNSYCVPAAVVCDDYDQCGDSTDEQTCTDSSADNPLNVTSLVAGVCLGVAGVILLLVYVIYRRHQRNQWRRFLKEHIDIQDLPDPAPSYPVTYKYFRGIRGHPGVHANHRGVLDEKTDP